MKRDGHNESLWQQSGKELVSAILNAGQEYDVVVAGAGITGVTTALPLQQAGKKVLLAEAQNPGFGTTGGTTAHLNNFFDSSYDEVIKNFGSDNARLFAEAGKEGMSLIKQNIGKFGIDCDYSEQTGYIFSVEQDQVKILEDLDEGTKEVDVEIDFINDSPFPIPYLSIASLPGQAQFNPILYIDALLQEFIKIGGAVLNNCRVTGTVEDEIITVETSLGNIKARYLDYATHIPPGVNILHFRNAPYRSYAMAVKLEDGKYPQALGYDFLDPYHYYRSQKVNGEEYLVAGGEDHKTGHGENSEQCFRALESYLRKFFAIEKIAYKWSSQYFIPVDGLPYIGHLPGNRENVFAATGFNGNGMILGTISGKIISDLILTGASSYKQIFNPARVKPLAGFSNFMKEAADVAARFVTDKFGNEKISGLAELAAGEAKVIKHDGYTVAIYKDEQHMLHAVNAACTHIKCTVAWNDTEKSWDCPCHGSRFSMDGELLTAPARKNLEKITL